MNDMRQLIERIERDYAFECEAGPLALCHEWQKLKALAAPSAEADALRAALRGLVEELEAEIHPNRNVTVVHRSKVALWIKRLESLLTRSGEQKTDERT